MQVILEIPDADVEAVTYAVRRALRGGFPRVMVAEGTGKDAKFVEVDNPDVEPIAMHFQDLADDLCCTATAEHARARCEAKGASDKVKSDALLTEHNAKQRQIDLRAARVQRAIPTGPDEE